MPAPAHFELRLDQQKKVGALGTESRQRFGRTRPSEMNDRSATTRWESRLSHFGSPLSQISETIAYPAEEHARSATHSGVSSRDVESLTRDDRHVLESGELSVDRHRSRERLRPSLEQHLAETVRSMPRHRVRSGRQR